MPQRRSLFQSLTCAVSVNFACIFTKWLHSSFSIIVKHRFLLDCAALAESGNTMSIREERKQQSRQAIMDAVLQLSSAGRAFSSIS
jgi:hypothetical protein